ncbi:5'-methylthioadenosine/S-adenosylhomocysteine nucleosidase [Mycobacterium sp. MS1601]|uniref:5'-methylthioadenosine/adenosylhomocysteine nucleosidase n=1 Tax=Mycobacterium sp. MS1601 TaxID=1936029 RepID=UPI00097957D1|nr:5'-methylthioadenosine/adenosylhomocysteine nucleosidase [Mycobacterium sp. MS1601]AQA06077.1 5'-methylthioadenosine/S-adenosylhomocysteine nucleosidase [Mycobacterium sp. MS1601]
MGVICAIPEELAHLRDILQDAISTVAGPMVFHRGLLDGYRVVLVGAGMGKVNAAAVTALLIHGFGCTDIVLSGVAGGLDPDLAIGDIVIADKVIQHDCGRIEDTELVNYQPGHVSFINPTDELGYVVDPALLARVRERVRAADMPAVPTAAGGRGGPPHIAFGTILTGDQYIHCEDTRTDLFRRFTAKAVEMEGGAVAQVCSAFGVPWLVIRALSDLAGRDSSFDFPMFVDSAAATSAAVLRTILPVLR